MFLQMTLTLLDRPLHQLSREMAVIHIPTPSQRSAQAVILAQHNGMESRLSILSIHI
jgi:hypothetical protein